MSTSARESGNSSSVSYEKRSVGVSEEINPKSLSDIAMGTTLQAYDVSPEQNLSPTILASTSFSNVSSTGNAPHMIQTSSYAAAQGSQIVENVGVHSAATNDSNFGRDRSHNSATRPSPLDLRSLADYHRDPMLPKLGKQDNQSTLGLGEYLPSQPVQGRHGYSWQSHLRNRLIFGGYQPESYERTRLSRIENDGIHQQGGSSSWPASPIRPYKTPLSRSSPATDPLSHCYSLTQTTEDTKPPHLSAFHRISPQSASSQLTQFVHSPAQSASQQQSPQLDLRNRSQPQPRSTDSANSLSSRRMSAALDEVVQENLPCSPTYSSMQQSVKNSDSGARKRPRAVNQNCFNSAVDALATDPEGFKVSIMSAFTRKDHENINVLVAAMNDMSSTEDNDGMLKSWNKLRMQKAAKVVRVCEDLLVCI